MADATAGVGSNADLNTGAALEGRVALVTGASRGIGQAIAVALARQGAFVIGTGTSAESAKRFDEALAAAAEGGRPLKGQGMALDVADAQACTEVVAAIEKAHGAVAILVNNAGITRDNLAMRMKDDEWSAVVETNLSAVFRLSRLVMRGMVKARAGRIINVTSVVGTMGNAGQANYAAAKAGVVGMSKSLARELGGRNITVNCVAPGFIDTDMTRALNEGQVKALESQIPLGRFGRPEDIADAVAFLASDRAAYVTGVTLHVNGGMLMD